MVKRIKHEVDENTGLIKARRKDLLSSGSTLLNLACSGNPHGGFLKGTMIRIVGDSGAGKTFLCMSCFAEASINEFFEGYRFIYDNRENGNQMDMETMFNAAIAARIEPPHKDKKGNSIYSDTIESLYYNIMAALEDGRPFIYVIDSMDALDSEASMDKFQRNKKVYMRRRARAGGEDVGSADEKIAGSFGDGKAKKNSENLRKICLGKDGILKNGSIIIMLSQTRDDIGARYAGARTTGGGRSPKFYATNEFWTRIIQKIKKKVRKKDREIGVRIQAKGEKSRLTGKYQTVALDIYPSYGIDDIGSNIDWLVEEGFWPRAKGAQKINAKGLGMIGTRERLIRLVEKRHLENDLREEVGRGWEEIERESALKRKRRYA